MDLVVTLVFGDIDRDFVDSYRRQIKEHLDLHDTEVAQDGGEKWTRFESAPAGGPKTIVKMEVLP